MLDLRCQCICHKGQWVLVHWPEEDSVSIIKEEDIVSPLIAKPGDKCSAKVQGVELGSRGFIMESHLQLYNMFNLFRNLQRAT